MRDAMIFDGYASLFQVPDSGGDLVLPGAFAASLARRGPAGVRMLFQHDPAEPVGRWLDLREDARGLKVRGLLSPGVQRADEIAALIRYGALDGLSIGFRTVRAHRPAGSAHRHLARVDLWEISLVTFPMLAGARVTGLAPVQGSAACPAGSRRPGHRPPPDADVAGLARRLARAAGSLHLSQT